MNNDNTQEELNKLLKDKIEEYYNENFKLEKNINKIMNSKLQNIFLKVGQLYFELNCIYESLEKFKNQRTNKNDNINIYIEKISKFIAIFDLAIATFEEITTEIHE